MEKQPQSSLVLTDRQPPRLPLQTVASMPLTGLPFLQDLDIQVVRSLDSVKHCDLLVIGLRGSGGAPPTTEAATTEAGGGQGVASASAAAAGTALPTDADSGTGSGGKPAAPRGAVVAVVPAEYEDVTKGALTALVRRQHFTATEMGKSVVAHVGSETCVEAAALGLGSLPTPAAAAAAGPRDDGARRQTSLSLPAFPLSVLQGFEELQTIPCDAAATAGRALGDLIKTRRAERVALSFQKTDVSPEGLQALLEGLALALTPDDRFKSQKTAEQQVKVSNLWIHIASGGEEAAIPEEESTVSSYIAAVKRLAHTAEGIQLARELLNSPPNYCTTESLARAAVNLAVQWGLEHEVLGEEECRERKMGAYLAVHQGSVYAPQFIHLTYRPQQTSGVKRIALIGKGVCMDTGGYNLKVGCGIETMKMDMGAAAAVFGAARVIAGLKPEGVEVHFIVAAAENMVSARAYRPGDIVTASNGKTIEVGNTDAEGRLTLADALVFAEKVVKPDFILDCATLTGAILVALGQDVAALYGTDPTWIQHFLKSAHLTGTPLWPMPLYKPYRKLNESKLADIANVSTVRMGGSITAALFLKEFVEKTPWCHIDMAGPVYDATSKEGTGYGVKLLAHAVLSAVDAQH